LFCTCCTSTSSSEAKNTNFDMMSIWCVVEHYSWISRIVGHGLVATTCHALETVPFSVYHWCCLVAVELLQIIGIRTSNPWIHLHRQLLSYDEKTDIHVSVCFLSDRHFCAAKPINTIIDSKRLVQFCRLKRVSDMPFNWI
jgi:hypothetical protein